MKFNENLKYLRIKAKLTQEQLAEELNVSRQAVTKWESGQALPDIQNLKELAIFFGLTVDELLGDEKTTDSNSLQKKLKDLPLFLFASIVAFLIFVSELGITDISAFGIILIVYVPILVWELKSYFSARRIIDLRDTKEGKKARTKFVLIEATTLSTLGGISQLFIYTVRKLRGLEVYETIPSIVLMTILMFIILIVVRVLTLRDEVKEYNSK